MDTLDTIMMDTIIMDTIITTVLNIINIISTGRKRKKWVSYYEHF